MQPEQGRYVLKPEVAKVLSALVWAIQETYTNHRIIITCRYDFESDILQSFYKQSLEAFRNSQLQKYLSRLENFDSGKVDEKLVERALKLAEYVTVEGKTIVGKLPREYQRHYGPTLISFTVYQHHQCRVPQNLILEQQAGARGGYFCRSSQPHSAGGERIFSARTQSSVACRFRDSRVYTHAPTPEPDIKGRMDIAQS